MADFERLGLEIVAKDSATQTLSKVVELLKDIKKNSSSGIGKIDLGNVTQTSANSTNNLVSAQKAAINSTKNLRNATSSLSNETKKNVDLNLRSVVSFAALFAIVRKTSRMFATIVKESGAYVENLNLFAITFGKEYQKTLDWSLQLSKNLGLSSNELIKFTGLFKQLATSIGVADATGTQMSKTLTQLGLDLSSFYNIDITTAMEKLQAGIFSGQTKPLIFGGIIKRFIMKKLCEPRNLGCEQYQIAC